MPDSALHRTRCTTACIVLLTALASGPAAYGQSAARYRCDEGAGATVVDDSGNGNDGVNSGVTYTADTEFPATDNFALVFDDTHDAVTIAADASTNVNAFTALTLEARIRPSTTSGLHFVLWMDDGPFAFYLSNGVLIFSLAGSGGAVSAATPFTSAGAWTHVAGTYDGTTARLYVNGTEIASAGGAVGTIQAGARKIIRIGNDETADLPGAFNRDFRGAIDDVRIVARALTPEEVLHDATHSFTPGATPSPPCAVIARGGGASTSGNTNALMIVGQSVIGRATGTGSAAATLRAGGIHCLATHQPGDCDHDGDVDHADHAAFTACLQGPAATVTAACTCFDLNGDSRVDLADAAAIQRQLAP